MILIARLLPFISFDIISYMAGLSGIRPWSFIFGTALGMLPATIIYSSIGNEIHIIDEHSPIFLTYTVVFIFIFIVFGIVQNLKKN